MTQPLSGDDDARLAQAVREYLEELEAGRTPDRRALLARYADLADALDECLDGLEIVHQVAPRSGSHGAAPAPLPAAARAYPANPLGDFQILREIGRGGMGVVYEAVQLSLGRRVALKVLPFAATFDAKHLQRFHHEAQAAAQLHHTNIVPVYAVGCERGVHFYAMQLIEGQSLDVLIRQLRRESGLETAAAASSASRSSGRHTKSSASADSPSTDAWPASPAADWAPAARTTEAVAGGATLSSLSAQLSTQRRSRDTELFRFVARLMAETAEALEYAHQQGIVHRDIKPANLLVEGGGKVWITDFGLAQFLGNPGLTQTGDVLGTLRYMSPEQASGQRVVLDHRTDIYSLGAAFYEFLTLQPVFTGATHQALLEQVLNRDPRPPRAVNPAIPVELETILLKTLSKSAADRYPSAQSLADDLNRFLRDEPIEARRPSPAERVRKWARRHPSLVWASAAAMFLVLVVSLVANWRITEANNVAREALRQERLRAEEAERRFTQARQAVDLLIDVSEKELADNPPAQGLRKRLLETALVYYQGFISERRGDPSSQAELIAVRERLTKILDDLTVLEGAGELALLSEPSIQQDLGLTEAQRARIQVVTQQFAQSRLDSIRDFHQISAADRRARFLQWARSSEEAVQQTLTEAQLARLRQIGLQLQGPMAFSRPEVVSSLRLSDAQRQTIRQIETEGMAAGWDYMHSETRQPPPAEFHKQVRQQCMQRILAALTPEQLSRWNELTGEKMRDAPDMPPPPEFFPPPEKPGP